MNKIDHIIQHAKRLCEKNNVKLTAKRETLLRIILENKAPLSAYELIDIAKEQYNFIISAMSIYRMLNVLELQNLIHRLKSTNKYMACAHITCKHEHNFPQFIICKQCGMVKEFDISESLLDNLKLSISSAGFSSKDMQLELESLCNNCAKANA